MATLASSFLIESASFLHFAGNEDMHKFLNEFEFLPDPINDYGAKMPLNV